MSICCPGVAWISGLPLTPEDFRYACLGAERAKSSVLYGSALSCNVILVGDSVTIYRIEQTVLDTV